MRTRSIRPLRSVRAAAVVAATAVVVITTVAPAQADYDSGGMPSRSFNVKTVGINDTWVGIFDAGRNRWNNAGAGARIGRSSSAAATFTAGSYSASWLGLYTWHGVRGINRTFDIQVNTRKLQADAGSNYSQWCYSTTTHEIGHALSLADNPNTTQASIMKHSRNRTTSQFPTGYDASEVRRIYS